MIKFACDLWQVNGFIQSLIDGLIACDLWQVNGFIQTLIDGLIA